MKYLWILMLIGFGCSKDGDVQVSWGPGGWQDDCDDTAAGACDTGAEEVDADGSAPTEASCDFSGAVCIETTNADPAAWCAAEGGTHADAACADGYDGMCGIPANGTDGTFADAAVAYYYGWDATDACTDVGGTYTAS